MANIDRSTCRRESRQMDAREAAIYQQHSHRSRFYGVHEKQKNIDAGGSFILTGQRHDSQTHDKGTSARPSIRQHQKRIRPPRAYVAELGLTKAAPLLGQIRAHGHVVWGMASAACGSPTAGTAVLPKRSWGITTLRGCRR